MTIIPDHANISPANLGVLNTIQAFVDGLNAISAFLKAHAELLPQAYVTTGSSRISVYLWYGDEDTARGSIEEWAAAAVAEGVPVEPYADHKYAGVHLRFGPASVQIYTRGHVLGERVQVVTEEWRPTITIPAPAAGS